MLFLAIMPAFLQCYCRLFVNPLPPEHRLAPGSQTSTRDCARPTDILGSRSVPVGRVMSQGGAPVREHVNLSRYGPWLADCGPRGPFTTNHSRR